MKIPCSNCNQRLEIPDELAGQTIECPACNASLAVPSLAQTPSATPQVKVTTPQAATPQKPTPQRKTAAPPKAASSKKSKSLIPKLAVACIASVVILSLFFVLTAKVEAPDISIHKAARTGNIEAVKQHLAAGTDVNARHVDGSTPLDWAISNDDTEIADLLRKHGAKSSESSDHSGTYILEANHIFEPITLELKPDGSFTGTSSDKMIGSWKVEGDLLVCEASSRKPVIKFNKASGKLNSFSNNGNEYPWKRFLAEEGKDGLYFKKN